MSRKIAIVLAILGTLVGNSEGIPKHSLFNYEPATGLFRLQQNTDLRLNIKGGAKSDQIKEKGEPAILWPCGPLNHELFIFKDGLIKLKVDENMCINVAGGASPGSNVNLWPCEHGGTRVEHEEFEMRDDGRIALKQKPDMCLNIKGGAIEHGSEVILWPCSVDGDGQNDVFSFNDGYIQVKGKPEFHFNIQGELKPEAKVVIWSCQAGPHESFDFTDDGRIRLKMMPDLCLNAEGGVAAGHRIIAYPCFPSPEDNELFAYDSKKSVIYSKRNSELGFNVAGGGMNAGDEIVLWDLRETDEL